MRIQIVLKYGPHFLKNLTSTSWFTANVIKSSTPANLLHQPHLWTDIMKIEQQKNKTKVNKTITSSKMVCFIFILNFYAINARFCAKFSR